jgi:two-component system, response regulator, stage 0 sporulation protein F
MANVPIVDDDLGILRVFGLIIEQEEHTAFKAAGGVKALEVLEAHHIDLAFIDLVMPEMDGIELMKRVRELYPHVKLAPMSAFADLQGVPSEYAAVASLEKPFAVEDVQAVLAKALEKEETGEQ